MSRIYASGNEETSQRSQGKYFVDDVQIIEIKGDQRSESDKQSGVASLNLTYFDLWALGLTTAIGGHFFSWTPGLSNGFGAYVVTLTLVSAAYFCLMMCISELSSALPFAGGVYGLARVTLGVYPGYLVAVMDTFKSILTTSSAAFSVGRIITTATDGKEELNYLYWFIFYVYCFAISVYGGQTFWNINKVSAFIAVVFLIIYIFGVIRYVDFNQNAPLVDEPSDEKWFHGTGIEPFLLHISSPANFFTGIQSINLASGQLRNPKTDVPKAYMCIMTTLICTCFVITFLASSVAPGVNHIVSLPNPLTPGFAKIFNISPKKAILISLPITFIHGNTYMYYFGQQMSAMGRSGLLPLLLGQELPGRRTPMYALLAGSIVSYAACVLRYHVELVSQQLFNMLVLAVMGTYIVILISFILFRNYFSTIKREFLSPLGIAGAVYALLVFSLQFISVVVVHPNNQDALMVFVVIVTALSIYYYLVVRHRQVFSEEEKTVMFTAYVLKGNHEKAARMKKGVQTRLRVSSKPAPPYTPTPTNTPPSPAQALPAHADSFVGSQAEDSHAASSRMEDGTHIEDKSVEIVTTTSPDGSLMPNVSVAATTPRNRFKERKE